MVSGAMALSVFLDAEAKESFLKIGRDQEHRREIANLQSIAGVHNQQRLRAERQRKEVAEEKDEQLDEAYERIDILQEALANKEKALADKAAKLEKAYDAIDVWQRECEAARKEADTLKDALAELS